MFLTDKFEIIKSAAEEIKKLQEHFSKSNLFHVYQNYREQLFTLIHTAEDIQSNQKLNPSNLKIIEEGIKASWDEVYYYHAGSYLCLLSHYFPEAVELFYRLANDRNWKVRKNTVKLLKLRPQIEVIDKITSLALHDKSRQVVLSAFESADRFKITELIPEMENIYKNEKVEKYKKSMDYYLSLLKDGYYLHEESDPKFITIKTEFNSLETASITDEELHKKGIKKIVEELRGIMFC
jgi:hypothetical protein